jgi:hypothetical protein
MRFRDPFGGARAAALASAFVLGCSSLVPHAWAAHVVVFSDGRSLEVEDVTPVGESLVLTLAGGSSLAIPAERVETWGPVEPRARAHEPRPEPAEVEAWRQAAGAYAELIGGAAERHRLPPELLTAVAIAESALDPRAVSPKGARGLLQLMPDTATRFGVTDLHDPRQNIEAGAQYLHWLLERFEGRTDLALAGYNAGEGAVERHGGIPPYPETRSYVARVLHGMVGLAP